MRIENQRTALLTLAFSVLQMFYDARVVARLFGGLAIDLLAPWSGIFGVDRPLKDIDIVIPRNSMVAAYDILRSNGWTVTDRFRLANSSIAVHATQRDSGIRLDVYGDPIVLNQTLFFGQRLRILGTTLTPIDLLISKLQIVNVTTRDLNDICALVGSCEISPNESANTLNVHRLAAVCSSSWGFQHSSLSNLSAARDYISAHPDIRMPMMLHMLRNTSLLATACAECDKGWAWRLRAKIGTRLPWYEEIDPT